MIKVAAIFQWVIWDPKTYWNNLRPQNVLKQSETPKLTETIWDPKTYWNNLRPQNLLKQSETPKLTETIWDSKTYWNNLRPQNLLKQSETPKLTETIWDPKTYWNNLRPQNLLKQSETPKLTETIWDPKTYWNNLRPQNLLKQSETPKLTETIWDNALLTFSCKRFKTWRLVNDKLTYYRTFQFYLSHLQCPEGHQWPIKYLRNDAPYEKMVSGILNSTNNYIRFHNLIKFPYMECLWVSKG